MTIDGLWDGQWNGLWLGGDTGGNATAVCPSAVATFSAGGCGATGSNPALSNTGWVPHRRKIDAVAVATGALASFKAGSADAGADAAAAVRGARLRLVGGTAVAGADGSASVSGVSAATGTSYAFAVGTFPITDEEILLVLLAA